MFVVYSKPSCPQCDVAKNLLKTRGIAFKEIAIDVGQSLHAAQESISIVDLKKLYPAVKSAPVIARDTGEFVGSLNELRAAI